MDGWGGAARWLVRRAAGRLTRDRRRDFIAEWTAELEAERGAMTGPEVLRAAWGSFADAGALRRRDRGTWTTGDAMQAWMQDFKVALRSLARSPGFTAVAVITLALGLGGTAAIHSLVDRMLLDDLPYPEPERLVRLENQVPGVGPDEVWNLSTAQWLYFNQHADLLNGVAVYRPDGGNVQTSEGPQRARAMIATAAFLPMLGARAEVGRLISEDDDRPGAPQVTMLSHGFWERVLGSDPDVVGTTVSFNDTPFEVIGVVAEGLEVPDWPRGLEPDLWFPMGIDPEGSFGNNHVFAGLGRLAPGATPEAAESEIEALTAQLPEAFPRAYSTEFFERYGFRTNVVPLHESVVGDLGPDLWLLFGGVVFVLLIAAANAANLFLVRTEGRRRELGIRTALGAGKASVARHLLAESLALTLTGGVLALLVAYWGVPALAALAPDDLPRISGLGLGWSTAAFTLGASLLIGLGLAAYPMWSHATERGNLLSSEDGRSSTAGRGRQRLRSALVVTQMALALALVVGAGLLVRTLGGLHRTDVGFEPEGVVAMDLYLSPNRYSGDASIWNLYRELMDRVQALPEVTSVGMTEELPVQGGFGCTVQGFEDEVVYQRVKDAGSTTCAGQERTTPGYFETMGIPVLEGRALEAGDNDDPTRGSVVVSKAFAEKFWPGESALGKGVAPSGRTVPPFYRVVGVVGDVPTSGAADGQGPLSEKAIAIYYPIRRNPDTPGNWGWWWPGSMSMVVRTDNGTATEVAPAIRRIVSELDPEIPLANVTAMEAVVDEALAEISFISLMLGTAAAVALLLSAVGLYGVIAYVVGRRTREIGMRLAIGAQPSEVVGMVVRSSMTLAVAGLVVGVVLALWTTRLMGGMLVGVAPTDPVSYVVAGAALLVIAGVAAFVPAWRASRVDPVTALRTE